MMTDYGVRVIRAYAQFSVGRVIYPNGIQREMLLRGGWVEPVASPEAAPSAHNTVHSTGRKPVVRSGK